MADHLDRSGFRGGVEEWAPSFLLDGMLLGVVNRILRGQERKRVLSQISSLSREFALDATRRARDEGWLYDGSLCGRGLSRASLQGADLANVRFAGTDLTRSRPAVLPEAIRGGPRDPRHQERKRRFVDRRPACFASGVSILARSPRISDPNRKRYCRKSAPLGSRVRSIR